MPGGVIWGLAILVAVALGVVGFLSLTRDRAQLKSQVTGLTTTNQNLQSSLDQLKQQMQSMADRLNQESANRTASGGAKGGGVKNGAVNSSARPRRQSAAAPSDPRIARLQSQVSDQEKQLNSTREDLTKTREELQGKLDSTRDELSGSVSSTRDELSGNIARSHDEIVALQKRGERNYYEFQIAKSKDFKHVGPVSVSLRKANTKRKSFDLAMIVDDVQLQKKSVNLFEPVRFNLGDRPQPIELVVNKINKDQIEGYISEPKYKRSELGDAALATKPAAAAQQ